LEISYTLIVAIVFVTIMSMGLGNQLMAVTALALPRSDPRPGPLRVGWMLVMLMTYFLYIWQVTLLVQVESWNFLRYLYVTLGPSLLLTATGLLTMVAPDRDQVSANDDFFAIAPRFLLCLGGLHLWSSGFEPAVGLQPTSGALVDLACAAVVLTVSRTRTPRFHVLALIAVVFLKFIAGGVNIAASTS